MIPAEAVEAAMDAIFRTTPNLYPPSAKVIAQAALEAAAPYMQAWGNEPDNDEGDG